MSGAFPFFPRQPNPEDDENQSLYAEEAQELPPADDQAFAGQPVTTEEQPLPSPGSESSLPPEARGETNGGPLGCCLGVTVGIMLSLLIGVIGFGPLIASG